MSLLLQHSPFPLSSPIFHTSTLPLTTMAHQQNHQALEWALPLQFSNARLPIATAPYRPYNTLGKPSLPNLYHSHFSNYVVCEVSSLALLPNSILHLELAHLTLIPQDSDLVPIKPIRKMPKSSNLSLNLPAMSKERTKSSGNLRSPPLSPPYNSPHSPHSPARELTPNNGLGSPFDAPHSPITALPQPHAPNTPKPEKSKGIFSTAKFSKSQSRLATESPREQPSAMASVYQHGSSPGSTPELAHQVAEASSASDRKSPIIHQSQYTWTCLFRLWHVWYP